MSSRTEGGSGWQGSLYRGVRVVVMLLVLVASGMLLAVLVGGGGGGGGGVGGGPSSPEGSFLGPGSIREWIWHALEQRHLPTPIFAPTWYLGYILLAHR